MKSFRDRIAVVTGAASGIGQATAVALARQGCHVAVSDVNAEGLEETAAAVRAAGRRACCHEVDVADKSRMLRYVDEVVEEYGGVNIVVNNAGVSVASSFDGHSIEDFEWLMGINFWGVVYGCKFFLPHLKAADEAHIVNISSVFGIIGAPQQSSYCASKFAVRGFSEVLQLELAEFDIGVTSVHPGGIATNIAAASRGEQDLKDAGARVLSRGMPPERAADRIIEAIKANRLRQLITREAFALDWLKRAAPTGAQRLVGKIGQRLRRKQGLD